MSKRTKFRPITDWYIRTVKGEQLLIGWELYAYRPILARIVTRGFREWHGRKYPCYFCESRRYIAVGSAAPAKMWRVKNAIANS